MASKRISSPKGLEQLRRGILSKRGPNKPIVSICTMSVCGQSRGSVDVCERFKEEIRRAGLEDKVDIRETGCQGFCEREPVVIIFPEGIYYVNVEPDDVPEIISTTLAKGKLVDFDSFFEKPCCRPSSCSIA